MGERRNTRGDHAWARELLGPYVLGALESEEEKAVERHLAGCAACREEERELCETHERLAGASIAASSAPPDLERRIFAALPPRGGSEAPRVSRVLVAAAMMLFLFALTAVGYSSDFFDRTGAKATLTPTGLAPGAGGELEMQSSGPNAETSLEVWGLPPTGSDEYYELWFRKEEGRVSGGTFKVDQEGWGRLSASAPALDDGYQRVEVTLERFPEEPRMNSAQVVLAGDLQAS